MLGRHPEQRERGQPPGRSGRGRGHGAPGDDRGPLRQDQRQDHQAHDPHRAALASVARDDVVDPRDRGAPVRDAEEDPGPQRAAAALFAREAREPRDQGEGQQHDPLDRRESEREQQARQDAGQGRPPAPVSSRHASALRRRRRRRAGPLRRGTTSARRVRRTRGGTPAPRRTPGGGRRRPGCTYSTTGRFSRDGRRYCPIVTMSTAASRIRSSRARTSSSRSPSPSMKPDLVVRSGSRIFAADSSPSERSSLAPRRTLA